MEDNPVEKGTRIVPQRSLLVPDSLLMSQRESKQRRLIPRKPINLLTSHEGRSQVAPYSQIRLIATFFSAYFRKFPSLFNFSLEHFPLVGFMNLMLK